MNCDCCVDAFGSRTKCRAALLAKKQRNGPFLSIFDDMVNFLSVFFLPVGFLNMFIALKSFEELIRRAELTVNCELCTI